MAGLDLDAYFARIGYGGSRTPSAESLIALHTLHPAAIAFENLDPLMSKPVQLDVPTLHDKLVVNGRGGYCYEHNTLFQAVLEALGFTVSTLAARVQWRLRPAAPTPPRYHMVLRIDLSDESYIADVGFGRMTLTAPLRLRPNVEQPTRHAPYRFVPVDREYQLQASIAGNWEPIYQLSLQQQAPSDWQVANWFTSTHPESTFTKNLMASRSTADCLYGLFNSELSVHYHAGHVERRVLRDAGELAIALQTEFGIRLPLGCEAALERLFPAARL
jgi:N-hydroxyarylamine O-acetyltransferase